MADERIDRTRLPIADPEFTGMANRTLQGARPDWGLIGHVAPPAGAPNILLVLIDDAGFGQPSAFGGPIAAPAMTRVCDEGVRYNRFHVTALCSPTRAALLTGRNHHAVGFGSIGEFSSGFPGYTAFVPEDSAPFPKVLQGNGYSTAAFGKWHLTPDGQQGAAGPFGRWPNGWGFDHFWGFLGGESGQWDPVITENNKTIGVPQGREGEKYYFPDDMADKTIEWLHAVRAQDTGQAVVRVLLHRVRARAASCAGGVGGEVQGAVRWRLGRPAGGDLRAAEAAGRGPGRRGADGPQ